MLFLIPPNNQYNLESVKPLLVYDVPNFPINYLVVYLFPFKNKDFDKKQVQLSSSISFVSVLLFH